MAEFKCESCGKIFDNEPAMRQHFNDKHVERPVPQPSVPPAPVAAQSVPSRDEHRVKFKVGKGALYAIVVVAVVALAGFGAYWYVSTNPGSGSGSESLSAPIGPLGSIHSHADFALFLDGEEVTPLGTSYFVRNAFVHVESGAGAGTVIHMHATNVPLGFFFRSLGMNFNSECFRLDNGMEYCNEGGRTLKMFVKHEGGEWEENRQFHTYVFQDLDKILITYGDETSEEIAVQQNSVTDFSIANSDRQMDLRNLPR